MTLGTSDIAILSDQIASDLTLPISLTPDLVEHLRKLKAKYAFSAKLMLGYHAVLLMLLVILSWWHRRTVRSRRQRGQCADDNSEEKRRFRDLFFAKLFHQTHTSDAGVSDISTVPGEETPLVSSARGSRSRSLWAKWRAFLMHEPKPLPVFDRSMPPNATSLLICGIFALNLFFLLFLIEYWTIDTASVVGDRAAWLFVANLPWLYILAAKHQPIQLLTGHSYENLNILHRRLGEWLCVLAVLHGVCMLVSWYNFLLPYGLTLPQFLTIKYILFGVMALLSYELIYVTSLASFRAWWYEAFLGCHIILQAMALILLFLHHHKGRVYAGIALAIFLIDRVGLRLGTKTDSFEADLKIFGDDETVLVSLNWPLNYRTKHHWMSWTDRGMHRGWGSSEHVFLTVPALGREHAIQAHPFTIASAAPGRASTHAWLQLIIRAQAGFSRDLLQYARRHSSASVRLDGPYGSSHALEILEDSNVRIFIAGGSGIAVAYPLIWHLLMNPVEDRGTSTRGQFHLIWIVQDATHVSWLGSERLDELREKGLQVTLPPPTQKSGRPDVEALLRGLIQDEPGTSTKQPAVSVLVSGPDQLNRSVRNTCAAMVGEGWNIDVVVEKYGW